MAQRLLIVVLFILAVVTASSLTVLYLQNKNGAGSAGASADQINAAVKDFLEKNPEVVLQGLKKAQFAQQEEENKKSEESVKEILPKIQARKPMHGDENAPVTFALFNDYNCGFCKKSVPDVIKVAEEHKNVKVVLLDFPILGPQSLEKSKVSVAVGIIAPEKMYEYFKAVEEKPIQNIDQAVEVAVGLGIDPAQLRSTLESPEVENRLSENRAFADQLGVQGTPAFVINTQVIKGALGYEAFKAAIEKAAN